jgi:hypothetical protein
MSGSSQLRPLVLSVALLTVLLACPGITYASDLSLLLDATKERVDSGKYREALSAVRKATLEIWRQTPFFLDKSVLVTERAGGYGMYTPRPNNVYKQGEKILLYLQPAGYTIDEEGSTFRYGFTADFVLLGADEKVLGGKKNFSQWNFASREPNFEIMINMTYTLTGLPPGNYTIESTLHDKRGEGSVSIKTPITIKK